MEVIKLPSRTRGPKGGYGMYFYLGDGRGVKILKGIFRSRKAAENSHQRQMADKEYGYIKAAEGSRVSPKGYGVVLVQRGQYWRVGIVMEHLGATRLADLGFNDYAIDRIIERLVDRLDSVGVVHADLHEWNVMVKTQNKRNRYFAIDFSPDYAYLA